MDALQTGVSPAADLLDQCGVQCLTAAFLCKAAHEPPDSILDVCNIQVCAPHKHVVLLCSTIFRHGLGISSLYHPNYSSLALIARSCISTGAHRKARISGQAQSPSTLRSMPLAYVTAVRSPAAAKKRTQGTITHMRASCAAWHRRCRQRASRLLRRRSSILTTVSRSCWQ